MCVALDADTGRASVVGAGHPPLLVARNDGRTEPIPSSAPPLGLLERSEFGETSVNLEPGEAFFIYTDGLYGAHHDSNLRLSSTRLAEMLQPMTPTAQALLGRVVEKALNSNGDQPAPDDVAAIAVKRLS
jgi:sigma-B regulation protein RsbU (phosphoserine phosphatase)